MWGGAIKIGARPYKGRGVLVLVISNSLSKWASRNAYPTFNVLFLYVPYHYDSKHHYNYLEITLFNKFNLSTFRFIMGLVLILLMKRYCSLRVKLQIPSLSSAASVIIL